MTQPSVLVAGGAGYIGSHVCKMLSERGYLPVTLDNLSTGHRGAVRYGPLIEADIADTAAVTSVVASTNVVGAMHFAAQSLVAQSVSDPLRYYAENVGKGAVFLRALQAAGVDNVLFSSTAAVYGTPEAGVRLTETHATRPVNPYGATKLALEDAIRWSAASSALRWTILRYFNAAGADQTGEIGEAHDPETHLVPLVIGAALGVRGAVTVFGTDYDTPDGSAVRDYIHVTDLAEAHVVTFERMTGGADRQLFNVGTGRGHSVREVIEAADQHFGQPTPHILAGRRAGDPPVLVADSTRLQATGWDARTSSLSAILTTASRWHARPAFGTHRALTLPSVNRDQSLIGAA